MQTLKPCWRLSPCWNADINSVAVGAGRWKGVIVAIKVVEHSTSTREESLSTAKQRIDRESVLSTSLSHPNVITTFKICTIKSSRGAFDSASQAAGRRPHLPADEDADPLAIPWETYVAYFPCVLFCHVCVQSSSTLSILRNWEFSVNAQLLSLRYGPDAVWFAVGMQFQAPGMLYCWVVVRITDDLQLEQILHGIIK